ncbi:MAG: 3-methyladenine DNA glycosylase AlkD [Chlamydiales bacterium]|jgi:3-methyladenine DNA glycosylase AlkD
MKATEVLSLLKANQDERGIANWEQLGSRNGGLKSFGVGLTRLRKLAREVGRDPRLAAQLWKSRVYDARILGLLVDDLKQITREQAEAQVEQLEGGHLAHVFSTCGAPLAKVPFAVDLASDWIESKDRVRRRCGYSLLYEISKDKKKTAPDDAFFLKHVSQINKTYSKERGVVLGAMGGALMGIGKRNATLNAATLKVARRIGPIPVGGEDSDCDPFDVVKHLTSDYLTKKHGL